MMVVVVLKQRSLRLAVVTLLVASSTSVSMQISLLLRRRGKVLLRVLGRRGKVHRMWRRRKEVSGVRHWRAIHHRWPCLVLPGEVHHHWWAGRTGRGHEGMSAWHRWWWHELRSGEVLGRTTEGCCWWALGSWRSWSKGRLLLLLLLLLRRRCRLWNVTGAGAFRLDVGQTLLLGGAVVALWVVVAAVLRLRRWAVLGNGCGIAACSAAAVLFVHHFDRLLNVDWRLLLIATAAAVTASSSSSTTVLLHRWAVLHLWLAVSSSSSIATTSSAAITAASTAIAIISVITEADLRRRRQVQLEGLRIWLSEEVRLDGHLGHLHAGHLQHYRRHVDAKVELDVLATAAAPSPTSITSTTTSSITSTTSSILTVDEEGVAAEQQQQAEN